MQNKCNDIKKILDKVPEEDKEVYLVTKCNYKIQGFEENIRSVS